MSKKRILVLCPHPVNVAPGQRLKYEQYFPFFREAGYEIKVSPFMTMRFWNIVYTKGHFLEKVFWTIFGYFKRIFDLFRVPFYDGVYVFLWVTPFGLPLFEFVCRLFSKKIVYDIDDMVFLGHSSEANRFFQSLKGKKKMIYLMGKSDHVITCTPKLDEFVRKFNTNTTDISSTINTEEYIPINQYKNEDQIVLGWSGSHSTSKYLKLLEAPLKKLQERVNFKLLVIGDGSFNIPGINIEAIDWKEEDEVKNLQKIDIGLYPLPDEPWVYGKSGLKALQYMALGIPTVASSVGTIHRIIDSGTNGFLVLENNEWENILFNLINDAETRKKVGTNGRTTVEDRYSLIANKDTYLSIFEHIF